MPNIFLQDLHRAVIASLKNAGKLKRSYNGSFGYPIAELNSSSVPTASNIWSSLALLSPVNVLEYPLRPHKTRTISNVWNSSNPDIQSSHGPFSRKQINPLRSVVSMTEKPLHLRWHEHKWKYHLLCLLGVAQPQQKVCDRFVAGIVTSDSKESAS